MRIAHDTLVMVADGEKLLLFRNEGDERYPVLQALAHEDAAHPATREQGSDAPGRTFSSTSERRSSYDDTDWHEQDEARFARHAVEALGRAAERTDAGIVLLAAPRTLGAMRQHLPANLAGRIVAQIPKDFAHRETDAIAGAIAAHAP